MLSTTRINSRLKHSSDSRVYTEGAAVHLAIKTLPDYVVQWFKSQQDLVAALLPIVCSQEESVVLHVRKMKKLLCRLLFVKTGVLSKPPERWESGIFFFPR